jgi:hypothetical protein
MKNSKIAAFEKKVLSKKMLRSVDGGRVYTDVYGAKTDWFRDGLLFDTGYINGVKITTWGPGNSIP